MSSLAALLALTLATADAATAELATAEPATADAAVESAAPPPSPTVRVHAHSRNNARPVRVEVRGTGAAGRVVCTSEPLAARASAAAHRPFASPRWGDCIADVPAGTPLAIVLGDLEGGQVVVPDSLGSDLYLEVSRDKDTAAIGGGITMIVVGGLSAVVGLLGLAWYGGDGFFHDASRAQGSAVLLVAGVLVSGGGVGVLVNEARSNRQARVAGEFRDPARTRAPEARGLVPFVPLTYGFTF